MAAATSNATAETLIRKLFDDRGKAIRAKDINGVMSNIAPDVLSFDVVNPLLYLGSDATRKRAEEWFSSFQGPIDYEIRDLSITTGETTAFCHSLNRISGTKTDGGVIDMWVRATVCCRKIDGKWMVTHEHSSVPFDVESGKASLDLKPGIIQLTRQPKSNFALESSRLIDNEPTRNFREQEVLRDENIFVALESSDRVRRSFWKGNLYVSSR